MRVMQEEEARQRIGDSFSVHYEIIKIQKEMAEIRANITELCKMPRKNSGAADELIRNLKLQLAECYKTLDCFLDIM